MTEQIDIPKIGPVPKNAAIAVGVGVVAFLGWRYYRASSGGVAAGDTPAEDPGFEDAGTIPGVDGATDWYGSGGGSPLGDTTSSTPQGLTTNAAWSQYASNQLVALDVASGADIGVALGNYLTGKPLTSAQQSIVNAAIAYAGYPPVGSHVVVPGGDTELTIAPSGLKVVGSGTSYVTLSWSPVAGAAFYDVYRSGAASNAVRSNATTATIAGLQPNTSYTFQVAAVSGAGKAGPKSSSATGKTAAVSLTKPATPTVSRVTATTAVGTTTAIAGADGYEWFLNGHVVGHSDGRAFTYTRLSPKTKYTAAVRADTSTQAPGPASAARSFTTKSK